MRLLVRTCTLAGALAAAAGCSPSQPTQPQMSHDQVQELMKQGKDQAAKERGGRGPGGAPVRR